MENSKFKSNFKNVKGAEKNENGMAICRFKVYGAIDVDEDTYIQIEKSKNDMMQSVYKLYWRTAGGSGFVLKKTARRLATINKVAAEYGVVFIEDK